MSDFVLSSLSIFLSTWTSVDMNLNPLKSDNNFFSLFLIADSVSLSCNSGLKEFPISTLWILAKPLQAGSNFVIFRIFC